MLRFDVLEELTEFVNVAGARADGTCAEGHNSGERGD